MVSRRPAKRLLILPALLVVALLVMLHVVRDAGRQPAGDELSTLEDLAPVAGEEIWCRRPHEPGTLGEVSQPVSARSRVTSGLVLACPAAYDDLRVRYVGELVGDLLVRDGGAWVQVNDDAYALEVGPLGTHDERRGTNSGLTVWLPEEVLDRIVGLGAPGRRGDIVEVQGRIVRTDPADGGGLTLRADTVTVVRPATDIEVPFDLPQAALAVASAVAGASLWLARRRSSQG